MLLSMWWYFLTNISGTVCRSPLQGSTLTLDGLGLASYCLVIYYQNMRSCGAGVSAALSNRFGDVTLFMVIFGILNCGSWSCVYYLESLSGSVGVELISFVVVLVAVTLFLFLMAATLIIYH